MKRQTSCKASRAIPKSSVSSHGFWLPHLKHSILLAKLFVPHLSHSQSPPQLPLASPYPGHGNFVNDPDHASPRGFALDGPGRSARTLGNRDDRQRGGQTCRDRHRADRHRADRTLDRDDRSHDHGHDARSPGRGDRNVRRGSHGLDHDDLRHGPCHETDPENRLACEHFCANHTTWLILEP
eukprot:CAMPEP_0194503306 /NCGR_PEP_ID=MMETSP0253-20130528/28309_1 /TAXON_ID=2966 /ORGANISM="Noctiluca scintillans" /LENGTH=181 /DNA_ID=CAMNT_0039345579 /DNA_START=49 /DNA_END=595 /DNA_ORIENTATION=-